MTVEIRLIGSPEEVSEAESLLRDRFVIHSMRHYASRYSDTDRRAYIRASPREGATSEVMEVPEDPELDDGYREICRQIADDMSELIAGARQMSIDWFRAELESYEA